MTAQFSQPALLSRLSVLGERLEPGHIALSDGRRDLDYPALTAAVRQVADWLEARAVRVVALQADNSVDWVLVDLACQVAGVICLPLPPFFTDAQRQHCLLTAGAGLLLADQTAAIRGLDMPGLNRELAALPPCPLLPLLQAWSLPVSSTQAAACPAGTGKITFTSGSTGAPKGVCLSTAHQWRVAQALADAIAINAPRHLCLLPLATLLENLAGVYTPLLCGGTVLLPSAARRGLSGSSGLDVSALLTQLVDAGPATLILIPQLLHVLLGATRQGWRAPASLRFVAVGGARVAPALVQAARAGGLPVYEGYGLSECGSVVALNTPQADCPGAVGRVLDHCRVEIRDGEVVVTGASFLGYLGQPDSWYPETIQTGDLGQLDNGFLQIAGRRKNVLITAFGRNVSPEWVESALGAKPLLSQWVVAGDGLPQLLALLSAPETVSDAEVAAWIAEVNRGLPDYARIGDWRRLPLSAWQGWLTANGRPRRQIIEDCLPELFPLRGEGIDGVKIDSLRTATNPAKPAAVPVVTGVNY